ncbi:glycosyl hydrolase family 61-domain-containing protein [Xylariaceae sp. FL1651]|nr:glycosyl hydrolase family 61-domain-containing protein [Xylariaceae sp. FL1651]
MGLTLYIAVLLAAIPLSQGHFAFVRVAFNGEWQAPSRFIRNKTTPYYEDWTPNTNVNLRRYIDPTYASDRPESVRCGRGNMAHAADTEVLTVHAGDTIEVAHVREDPEYWAAEVAWDNCPDGRGSCYQPAGLYQQPMDINHPGPFLAHLSKVPDGQDIHAYDGSGGWIKIYTLGLEMTDDAEQPVHWLAWDGDRAANGSYTLPSRSESAAAANSAQFVFNIPKQTPQGEYLLRFDMIWAGMNWPGVSQSPAQIYATCAQIQVESDVKGGTLPVGVQIPEDLSHTSPGMATSLEMYNSKQLDADYVYPGGPLWDGVTSMQDKPAPR